MKMPMGGGIETVLYNRYIATIGGFQLSSEVATAVAGYIFYCPIEIPYKVTIDRLGCCHGSVAAGNFYLAIYESEDEAPTTRLEVSADTSCNGTSRKELVALTNASLQLTAGLYYLALVADNGTDEYWSSIADASYSMPNNINNGPSWYLEDLAPYAPPPASATPRFSATGETRAYALFARILSVP